MTPLGSGSRTGNSTRNRFNCLSKTKMKKLTTTLNGGQEPAQAERKPSISLYGAFRAKEKQVREKKKGKKKGRV